MPPSGPTDPELLAEWLGKESEPAFHALVERYAGLALMSAKRSCGDDSMAAEASQLTFILLARKAGSLTTCASLGGWIHRTALMHAKNLARTSCRENRKRQHLQAAMKHNVTSDASAGIWTEMQPVLDEALAALSEKDREALLLRFYRSLSVREIAGILGIATDAAQKRVDRATGRLRDQLSRRGCMTGGSLAAVMLAGFAADVKAAAPAVSLFTSNALSAGAVSAGAITTTTILLTTAAMKTATIVVPAIAVLATAWVAIQHRSITGLEEKNARLEKELSSADSTRGSRSSPGVAQSRSKTVSAREDAGDENVWQRMPPGPERASAVTLKTRGILFEKNPARRMRQFSEFIAGFQADDFEAIAASFAEHDQQGRLFPQEYELFLTMAATIGGEAAMDKIFKQGLPLEGAPSGPQHSAMMAWAMEDPPKAVEWWNNFEESVLKEHLALSLINGVASTDIDFAWRALGEFPYEDRGRFMGSLVQQRITDQGADSAAQWLDSLQTEDGTDVGMLKHAGFDALFRNLVNLPAAKKSEYINQFVDEPWMQQSNYVVDVAGHWASQNGGEAIAWADRLPVEVRMNAVLTAMTTWRQKNEGEHEVWRAAHEQDPVFQEPIRMVDEFVKAKPVE